MEYNKNEDVASDDPKANFVNVKIQRDLDTGDEDDDFVIPLDTEVKMMWAVHQTSPDVTKMHTLYGPINGTFKKDGTTGTVSYIEESEGDSAYFAMMSSITMSIFGLSTMIVF